MSQEVLKRKKKERGEKKNEKKIVKEPSLYIIWNAKKIRNPV